MRNIESFTYLCVERYILGRCMIQCTFQQNTSIGVILGNYELPSHEFLVRFTVQACVSSCRVGLESNQKVVEFPKASLPLWLQWAYLMKLVFPVPHRVYSWVRLWVGDGSLPTGCIILSDTMIDNHQEEKLLIGSSLNSPYPVTKAWEVFSNRVFTSNFGEHPTTIKLVCIVWGSLPNISDHQHEDRYPTPGTRGCLFVFVLGNYGFLKEHNHPCSIISIKLYVCAYIFNKLI